jgi:hypothetical protein
MAEDFVDIFKQPDAPADRGKYLARVFGIFSEELVRIWAADPRAPYEDLGRPTLRMAGAPSGSTLDFTLRSRTTGKVYVAEMKCEIEYQNYKYFVLTEPRQLDHHNKPAFAAFQAAAVRSPEVRIYVDKKEISVDGGILIWGAATPEGRTQAMAQKGFSAVLTVQEIIDDLRTWKSAPFQSLLTLRRAWSNEMYDALLGDARLKSRER